MRIRKGSLSSIPEHMTAKQPMTFLGSLNEPDFTIRRACFRGVGIRSLRTDHWVLNRPSTQPKPFENGNKRIDR